MPPVMRFDRSGIVFGDTVDDVTNKVSFLESLHYSLAEENISLMKFTSAVASSNLDIGGGEALNNAVTNIKLHTSTSITTLQGVNRFEIQTDGKIILNPTGVDSDVEWQPSGGGIGFFLEGSTGNAGIGIIPENILHIFANDFSKFEINTPTSGSLVTALSLVAKSTGVATGTFGPNLIFKLEDSSGSTENILTFISAERDGANNSGKFGITTYVAGVGTQQFTIDKDGAVDVVNHMTATLFQHTAADFNVSEVLNTSSNTVNTTFVLQKTSTGNMIDGFGAGLSWAIEDNAGVRNFVGTVEIVRDGADNSGRYQIRVNNAGVPTEYFSIDHLGKTTFNVAGAAGANVEFLNSSSAVIATVDVADDALQFEDDMELQFGSAAGGDYRIFYDSTETALIYQGLDATNKQQVFIIGDAMTEAMVLTSDLLDNTTKSIRFSSGHYDYQTEELVSILLCNNTETANQLRIGGNSGSHNAITLGNLYAAANNTTLAGTKIFEWNIDRVEIFGNAFFKLENMTTTIRDGKTAENGDMIYNTTANVIQGFENGSWVNL